MIEDDSKEAYSVPKFNEVLIPEQDALGKIKKALEQNNKITIPWAKKYLDISPRTAKYNLDRLVDRGICEDTTMMIVCEDGRKRPIHVYALKV